MYESSQRSTSALSMRTSRHQSHRKRSGWIALGALGVGAARRGYPLVPAWPGLRNVPAGRLFDLVAGATASSGVARTGSSTLVVGDCVLEVAFPCMPGA